jgi:hypothetical protein
LNVDGSSVMDSRERGSRDTRVSSGSTALDRDA